MPAVAGWSSDCVSPDLGSVLRRGEALLAEYETGQTIGRCDRSLGGSLMKDEAAVLREGKLRVPGDLPKVALRVGEVAVVAAPEGILRRLDHRAASGLCQGQHSRHVFLLPDVVR